MSDEQFESVLAKLAAGEVDETAFDELRALHTLAIEGSRATIQEKEAAIEAAQREITNLKVRNHDMLMRSPGYGSQQDNTDDDDEPDDGEFMGGIDSLFTIMRRGKA